MTQPPNPPASLMTLRIIWAALILGQLIFAAVALTMGPRNPEATMPEIFIYIAVAMVATMIPVAYVVRAIVYRRGRNEDGSISPPAYASGNILFWAMCEGAAFFSLVCIFLNVGRGTPLLLAGICLAVQIVNFPTGRPMREA